MKEIFFILILFLVFSCAAAEKKEKKLFPFKVREDLGLESLEPGPCWWAANMEQALACK